MQATPSQAEKELRQRSNFGLKLLLMPSIGTLLPIIVLCIFTGAVKPNFWTWQYISTTLRESIFIGTCALGQAVVQLIGQVDLSVGMSGCFAGLMMGYAAMNWGWPLVPCMLLCLAVGAAVGFINGFCYTKLNLSPWITTLATQFVCTGLAITIGKGEAQMITSLGIQDFTRARPLNLSWLFFIFLIIVVVLDFVVRKTKFGYKLRAVGGNAESAQMAGINVKRIQLAVFILAGVLAAIGGMFDVMMKGCGQDTYGVGREFRTIICCSVGGISAGSGSIYGVAFGILLFHLLRSCLSILAVDTNVQLVVIGAVLVLAVILDVLRKRLEKKDLSRL